MDSIITVTLNPVIDIHYYSDSFTCGIDNVANEVLSFAAGKGMNVSRALGSAGISSEAFVLLGENNAEEYLKLAKDYAVPISCITTSGEVRQNVSINTPNSETRICMKNYSVMPAVLPVLAGQIVRKITEESAVVFSGSMPKGITEDDFVNFVLLIKKTIPEVKIIIDCPTISADNLSIIRPFMIKPNFKEALHLLGIEDYNDTDITKQAISISKDLLNKTNSEHVIISCGSFGAAFSYKLDSNISESGFINAPTVANVLTTVGAGDSMLGGILAEMLKQSHSDAPNDFTEAVKWGIAFGSAACMTKGTNPPSYADIVSVFKQIK